jgi:hypothetical protein
MSEPDKSAAPKEMFVIGAGALVAGLYILLVGADVLPVPGGRDKLHAPLGIVMCVGLAVFLAGACALLQGVGRANASGELPREAPTWMRVMQYLLVVATFASFGTIAGWIAFGGDARQFSGSFVGFGGSTNAAIGRIAFGIGAAVMWLCTIAVAVSGARKLRSQGRR